MSNPISTLSDAETDEEKELVEVEEQDTGSESASDEDVIAAAVEEVEEEPTESKGRMGLLALLLAALLVGSVAINLKQSTDVATLETQGAELEQALTAAVERIDAETSRANGAEAALDRVDTAVDVVNDRVLGLQEALDGLRSATIR